MDYSKIRFGIVIATYQRPDGEDHLKRAVQSVLEQTYDNRKLYIIGDGPNPNLTGFWGSLDKEHLFACNLPYAIGRDDGLTGMELWRVGGAAAMNFALAKQYVDEIDVTCHLDDDDYWLPNHLETLAKAYSISDRTAFAFTRCKRTYKPDEDGFPNANSLSYEERDPTPNRLIHSASSWSLRHINQMYIPRTDRPADSDLWIRIRREIEGKGLRSYLLPEITVVRESSQKYVNYGES